MGRLPRYRDMREHLLALTDRRGPDECWPWTGTIFRPKVSRYRMGGYGRLHVRASVHPVYAHRATYEAFVGRIPNGMTVDHTCFNTVCQNPAHMELVTQAENSRRYMSRRFWPARGRRSPIDESIMAEIREAYALSGVSQADLARRFGVDQSTVSRIVNFDRSYS